MAQLNTSYATFDVPPPTAQDSTKVAELWRIVSTTIANESGQWEMPDTGWPDGSPSYTGGGTPPDPGQGYQENERVHQIGTIDTEGFLSVQDNRVPQSDGPSGVYTPVFSGTKRPISLATDPDFSGALSLFSSTDEIFIDTRLTQYGLTYADLTES